MRLVLDTNVVVSALVWGGVPFRLVKAAADGDIELVTLQPLLDELREVLARKHLAVHLAAQQVTVEQAVALYADLAIAVSPRATPRVVPADADDDHVIAAAVAGSAAIVVSGDRHLLALGCHQAIAIVNAAEAVRLIEVARQQN